MRENLSYVGWKTDRVVKHQAEEKVNKFLGCETRTVSWLWFTYVYNFGGITKKSTINKLQIAYHNIFLMFLGMSKYESTSYLCPLFDVQSCRSVIRNFIYGFICRLDSSVNYIIKDILATSLRFLSRIRKHWCCLLYLNS